MSLGKHKFFCEMCRKQCKDENAFKQHKRSSQHQQHMIEFNEDPSFFVERFSTEFDTKFQEMFRVKYGTSSFMPVTKAYNEYIKDAYHTHLNSTKWTSLGEYVQHLEDTAKFQVKKEVIQGGEQIFIRMIDLYNENKDGTKKLSKEDLRELERKRDQKELEKTIKRANKLQEEQKKSAPKQEHPKLSENQGLIAFESSSFSIGPQNAVHQVQQKKPHAFGNVFGDDEDNELDLLKQYQAKATNLDKLIEHQTVQHLQQAKQKPKQEEYAKQETKVIKQEIKPQAVQQPEWARKGLIVKVKREGPYHKLKGEITNIVSREKVLLKIGDDQKEISFSENELQKVLPSEGGMVIILSLNKKAIVHNIDMRNKEIEAKLLDGSDKLIVKFDDVCKFNQ